MGPWNQCIFDFFVGHERRATDFLGSKIVKGLFGCAMLGQVFQKLGLLPVFPEKNTL